VKGVALEVFFRHTKGELRGKETKFKLYVGILDQNIGEI
jgi:hypothetical protein